MRPINKVVIEPLNQIHNRAGFNCGIASLDRYLKRQARQDIKRSISRVFIARHQQNESVVLGYYTLSTLSIDLSCLPNDVARKLPRHPIPAALIGRLAVDVSAQNRGMGRLLLSNAIKRTLAVGNNIAIYAMVVDAINQEAESFYQRYGFSHLVHNSKRLFLPLKSF